MSSPAFLLPTALPKHPSISTVQSLRPPTRYHTPRLRYLYPLATAAAAAPQSPQGLPQPSWQTLQNVDLYIPHNPSLILIFAGGLAASLSPRTTYSSFLTRLSNITNAAVIAHRTPPSNDHTKLARSIANDVSEHLVTLRKEHPNIPTFGMGHSLGAKLTLVASTDGTCREALGRVSGNILISFCNRSAGDAVPWAKQGKTRAADALSQVSSFLRNVDVSMFEDTRAGDVRENITNVIDAVEGSLRSEFKPTADETLALIGCRYVTRRNLVISFDRDDLDDAEELVRVLRSRVGDRGVIVRRLSGTHVTPMTPEVGNGFYSSGSDQVDGWVRDVGESASRELKDLIAVVAAFLKLQMQVVD